MNWRAVILIFASVLPLAAAQFTKDQLAWWAFQPVKKPAVPTTGGGWARNDIDQFIARQHAAQRLQPIGTAGKRELIRRVTFDLTGLPPTPKEIADFLKDSSTGAYEKVVDRLLASPRYGERQATFWLDLVRYADTVGYHGDQAHSISPYRDYVIRAFADNMPFDQFTIEQLAAHGGDGDCQQFTHHQDFVAAEALEALLARSSVSGS